MKRRFLAVLLMLFLIVGASVAMPSPASAAPVIYPLVVPDKSTVTPGQTVTFYVTTSIRVKQIQTMIDGVPGKKYTEYTETDVRKWQVKITFTTPGDRKVQFRCTMNSGSLVLIPKSPVVIHVLASTTYKASCTTKSCTSGKTIYFSLKTPDTITSVYAVIDGIKQTKIHSKVIGNANGIKSWRVSITFFKLGTRTVKFVAVKGSTKMKTFPSAGLTITVRSSTT